jgi:hypothetical protein
VANLTLSIPDALLEKTKQLANKRGISVNALVRENLERMVEIPHAEWWETLQRQLKDVRYTENWTWNRDELYERD